MKQKTMTWTRQNNKDNNRIRQNEIICNHLDNRLGNNLNEEMGGEIKVIAKEAWKFNYM